MSENKAPSGVDFIGVDKGAEEGDSSVFRFSVKFNHHTFDSEVVGVDRMSPREKKIVLYAMKELVQQVELSSQAQMTAAYVGQKLDEDLGVATKHLLDVDQGDIS